MTANLDADEILASAPPAWQTHGPAAHRRVHNVTQLHDTIATLERRVALTERRANFFADLHADESARCDRISAMRAEWEQLAVDTLKEAEDLRAELDMVSMRCFALEDKVAGLEAEADRLAESIEWVE